MATEYSEIAEKLNKEKEEALKAKDAVDQMRARITASEERVDKAMTRAEPAEEKLREAETFKRQL